MNSLHTKTHSSEEMTEFCFKNAAVNLAFVIVDEKYTDFFRMCRKDRILFQKCSC